MDSLQSTSIYPKEELGYYGRQVRAWQAQPENLTPQQMNTLRDLDDIHISLSSMALWIKKCRRLELTLDMQRLVEMINVVGTRLNSLDVVKHLLAMGVDFEARDIQSFTSGPEPVACNDELNIMLLFGFQRLRQLFPELMLGYHRNRDHTGFLGHRDKGHTDWSNMTLNELQSDIESGNNRSIFTKKSNIWFHIPWMNGIIVDAVIRRFKGELTESQNSYFDSYYHPWLRKYSANGYTGYREPSYKSSFRDPSWANSPCVLIVFPCLEVRAKKNWEFAKQTFETSRDSIISEVAKTMIHLERTLDETYYPGLSIKTLDARNDDQVISKEYRTTTPEPVNENNEPILLVPQLWLLRFGDHLLSVFPEESTGSLSDTRPFGPNPTSYEYPNAIRMGLLIASRILSFGQRRIGFQSPLDYFELSVVRLLSEVEEYTDPKVPSQPEIKKEHDFMHNIADIREELTMMQWILLQQDRILGSLIQEFEKFEWGDLQNAEAENPKLPGWKTEWEKVKLSVVKIREYQQRIEKIDRDAVRITGVIQEQLNLKRTHASIRDARTGLVLSAAVIGFTVITIIFAPLAFMTSLFALPLDSFLGNQYQFPGTSGTDPDPDPDPDPTAAYTTRYIAKWFVVAEVVSLIVTGLLVILCLWLFGVVDISAVHKKSKTQWRKLFHKEPNKKAETENADEENQLGSDQKATGFKRVGNFLRRRPRVNKVNPDDRV